MYTNFEVDRMLKSMTILVDTREQPTERFYKRTEGFNCPFVRQKLDFGDYSVACTGPDGSLLDFSNRVAIERKMSSDELCNCFTKGRDRFEREFIRARESGARVHIITENENWEKLFAGKYRSKLNPDALTASLLAWQTRYNIQLHFCKSETTGRLIYKILRYELKEILENEQSCGTDYRASENV